MDREGLGGELCLDGDVEGPLARVVQDLEIDLTRLTHLRRRAGTACRQPEPRNPSVRPKR